ncbi:MAG: alpha/beta hydrolase [Dehalococcoidia bacterium]|nr:alpha/beta hydrolase [Dehalococcoidia bacterium]
MPEMNLGDVVIHYEEAGQGPLALVFCHGLSTNMADNFVQGIDFWREHFGRALTWHHRGMGQSPKAAKYSLPLYALDMARLIDGLEIERVVVVGALFGGVVAQQFALDYPAKCAALVLDSTSSELSLRRSEEYYKSSQAQRDNPNAGAGDPESYVAANRTVAGLREHPLTPRLKNIACPVLIVSGVGRNVDRRDVGAAIMSRHLPNNRLELFEDSGPGVFRHQPQKLQALVVEFCREQGIIAG